MSTPCTELGYEVGQVFEVLKDVEDGIFKSGDKIVLDKDDGDRVPCFFHTEKKRLGLLLLRSVKRIYPPEELSKDVTFTCDETGKKTTLSRESAEAMNLI